MDCPFEGIPTVPPRKDMDHMVTVCLCIGPAWPEGVDNRTLLSDSPLQSAGVLLQWLPLQGDSTPRLASAEGEAGTV